ncbi:GNAT family N-acetyltransferase [Saprospiraceae bacterium]|nr:GNAT family N-acetyltransferase [Saprospiraceae bacterium]
MNHNIPVQLETNRLRLTELSSEDHVFILELTNSEGWIQFIGDRNVHSEEDALSYIEKIRVATFADYWTVLDKATGNKLGVITLIQRDYLDGIDIGFAFLPQYSKKGYAYEASKLVLDQLMESDKNRKIYAITQTDNIKSIKLCKKLGLKYLKTFEENGKDIEIYVITQE